MMILPLFPFGRFYGDVCYLPRHRRIACCCDCQSFLPCFEIAENRSVLARANPIVVVVDYYCPTSQGHSSWWTRTDGSCRWEFGGHRHTKWIVSDCSTEYFHPKNPNEGSGCYPFFEPCFVIWEKLDLPMSHSAYFFECFVGASLVPRRWR